MLESYTNSYMASFFGKDHLLSMFGLVITIALLIAIAVIVYFAIRLFAVSLINRLLRHTKSPFLHIIAKNKSLNMFAHLFAGIFLWAASQFITSHTDSLSIYTITCINKLSLFYVFITIVFLCSKLIWSLNGYYEKKFKLARQYPIYSYLKVAIFFVWLISAILIISFFANTSPWALLTGVGAVSAVFLLVFKDTLLGIISSIQVTASNIVRIGDRISLDKYGVDGVVTDIAINTVKIRNADNTLSTIPTYMLTSEIIKNWRQMEESGARRIKRTIHLNINSIKICSAELLAKLKLVNGVSEYLATSLDTEHINLALYRVYLEDYLRKDLDILQSETIMVRHLDTGTNGVPLEIYAFTPMVEIVDYEKVQADILEHALAMLDTFELKVFQSLT